MTTQEISGAVDAIAGLARQLEEHKGWDRRKEAVDALGLTALEIVLALRDATTDSDFLIVNAARHAVDSVTKALSAEARSLEADIRSQRLMLGIGEAAPEPRRSEEGYKAAPSAGDIPDAVRRWLEGLAQSRQGKVGGTDNHLVLELPLAEGRRHKVYIDLNNKDSAGERVVFVYTVCGPADPQMYARALEGNSRLSHAAFALLRRGEQGMLILVSRQRLAELTEAGFLRDLDYIARKGDRVEAHMQGGDRF